MDQPRRELLCHLSEKLAYTFQAWDLLDIALCHSSYVHEHPDENRVSNERLEFLGDAVLELCVTQMLFELFPQAPEGQLSKARSSLVNENRLAATARRLELGDYLLVGRGEESQNGRDKPSLLADALEAVLAAVYLDSGLEPVRKLIANILGPAVAKAMSRTLQKDYKTRLQELIQEKMHITPRYEIINTHGPDHAKIFQVALLVDDRPLAQGAGNSKKEAEQNAAKSVLERWEVTGELF